MDNNEKQKIYESIVKQYSEKQKTRHEEKIDQILVELAKLDRRSLIMVGCAYIEELCKSCVFETMTGNGKKEYQKRHSRDLTFSSATTFLYSQDYLSKEIFQLINYIRDIRNKYAHIAIIEENHIESINDRNKKIRDLLNGRWVTRDFERLKSILDVDNQLYYVVFENLIYGLLGLEMFILPDQKLARLQFVKNHKSLRISMNISAFNEHSKSYFANKFNK